MKCKVMGYDKYEKKSFSYELENVVLMSTIIDTIIIQYVDKEGLLQIATYKKEDVKIIIEN